MSKHDDYLDPDKHGVNDEKPNNDLVKAAFGHYEGPYDLYRTKYKYTDCGPSIGLLIQWVEGEGFEPFPGDEGYQEVEKSKWFYCDDLYQFGAWADMDAKGQLVLAIHVSSIVEGIDATTGDIQLYVENYETAEELEKALDDALEEIDDEADDLWKQTHGCETCAKHWAGDPSDWIEGHEEEGGAWVDDPRYEYGETPVWDECPECGGHGEAF